MTESEIIARVRAIENLIARKRENDALSKYNALSVFRRLPQNRYRARAYGSIWYVSRIIAINPSILRLMSVTPVTQ